MPIVMPVSHQAEAWLENARDDGYRQNGAWDPVERPTMVADRIGSVHATQHVEILGRISLRAFGNEINNLEPH
jgi:hypothetical protein